MSLLRLLTTACFSVTLLAACTDTPDGSGGDVVVEESTSADEVLDQVMADYWQRSLEASPLTANAVGEYINMDELGRVNDESHEDRRQLLTESLTGAQAIDRASLSVAYQNHYDVFIYMLEQALAGIDMPTRFMGFTTLGGWDSGIISSIRSIPIRTVEDYENYIKRLSKFGRFADENIANMRRGLEIGYVHPCESLDGYGDTIAANIPEDAELSFAYEKALLMPATIDGDIAEDLKGRIKAEIEKTVTPAFQRYLAFYENEYYPQCRDTYGLGDLENGAEAYAHLLRSFSTVADITAEEIHQIGLEEVARIRGRMEETIREAEFEGDFKEFLKFMRTNPDFYPKDKEEYLARIAVFAKEVDGLLPKYFATLPQNRFKITPVPDAIAPKTSMAYYQPGSLKAGRPGQFFINLYALDTRSMNALPALSLHEGEPGHHFQIALQQELGEAPEFRKYYFTGAYVEGWGLYTEYLGEEMGLYKTPYELFSRLDLEMWRACRLVVDTGLHVMGWSRQQAIDYLAENTSLSFQNITAEIDRYITMPGQAVSYKIGELKIKELRVKAEEALGDDFSLRHFHSHLLSAGGVPLALLEASVNDWIDAQKQKQD